ncbi:HIT-like domain-containing protein [Dendryphion nanum]|uniref:HIT-like domain-containing protein n=1 Tax=Dendryphion nanum TaxID=256645 RepID=A0A9P9E3S1_9PLEO|nr:HIT-like domain-containing protein [Dendryphion nanum]
MTSTTPPSIAAHVESLIPHFRLTRLLKQDQASRRISLLGTISSQPTILLIERAALPNTTADLTTLTTSLTNIKNLGANDIYAWFLANTTPTPSLPDLKLNLIHPCTPSHIKKYEAQRLRVVTETPEIYRDYVRPLMARKRGQGALDWIYNILDGRTEQEDVIYREDDAQTGFLLLPDLNWDRKTVAGLHLLGIVVRRDVWSVRDLGRDMAGWLKDMREKMVEATVKLWPEMERDQVKMYVHYQPTYYHFHIHIVHVDLEAGSTQATGKALGLENIISQLETMRSDPDAPAGTEPSMADVSLTYHLGEQSELWEKIYLPLKEGRAVEI